MHKEKRRVLIQIALFITTFITTTLAGSWWISQKSIFITDYTWANFFGGMAFSIPFILILTVHEFGHYFTAMYHKIKATLPYYIPLPPLPLMIGTMGAVIRLLTPVPSKKQNFDIGIAGPLAGFIMAFIVLIYGFANLPPAEYIYEIHPEYKQYGLSYPEHVYKEKENFVDVTIGKNLLFLILENTVADPARIPNTHEIMHYPFLFAGYLALVFTFLNLLPIGQLDGGHVLYGLAGFKKHRIIASTFFIAFMFYAGLGNEYINLNRPFEELLWSVLLYVGFLYVAFTGLKFKVKDTIMCTLLVFAAQLLLAFFIPGIEGYSGWLVFGFVIGRFVGIPHPSCEIEEPLDSKRIILGWIALLIFILCFSPAPIVVK